MDIGTSLVMVIGDGVKHILHKNNKDVYAKRAFRKVWERQMHHR